MSGKGREPGSGFPAATIQAHPSPAFTLSHAASTLSRASFALSLSKGLKPHNLHISA
jgi:hypothetical protein